MVQQVPIIDLSLDDDTVGKLFYEACTTTGAFYITNHGVSKSFVDDCFSHFMKLFDLPLEEKMKVHADENNRGYTPLGKEVLSNVQSKGDTKEAFIVAREWEDNDMQDPADSKAAKLPLHGPNQWFDEAVLPGFRKATEEYQRVMTVLATRIMAYLEVALGVPKGFFVRTFDGLPVAYLKLMKYHPDISDPSNGIFAAGPHTDYGLASIIATDEVPGLQVEVDGVWIDIPPIPGAFMILTGDLLKRWTNDKFKAALHRVVNMQGVDRYSTGFFYEPTFDTLVEVIPGCCDGQPPKHPPILSGDHLLQKMAVTRFAGYSGSHA